MALASGVGFIIGRPVMLESFRWGLSGVIEKNGSGLPYFVAAVSFFSNPFFFSIV